MRSRLTHKLNKVIFRLSPVLAERCNIDFKLETPSRAFMENEIFSYVNRLVRAANQRHRLLSRDGPVQLALSQIAACRGFSFD